MSTRQYDHHDGGGAAVEPTATHDRRHSCLNPRLLLLVCVIQCYLILCLLVYINPTLTTHTVNGIEPLTSSIPLTSTGTDKTSISNNTFTTTNITLLLWNWPYGTRFNLNTCSWRFKIHGCHITADKSVYKTAQGVVFHHRDVCNNPYNLPTFTRPQSQKWIWINFESPSNSPKKIDLGHLFNITVTYRQDSDITVPYGSLIIKNTTTTSRIPQKDKLICWVVSNWNPDYVRSQYYMELQKYVHVHVYGNAVGNHISNPDLIPLLGSCKFYLAFENSIHTDYISEKIYRSLLARTVPIVLGPSRQNYENYIPPHAFIHVNDYDSPRDLVKYLHILDTNNTMYNTYFQWANSHEAYITPLWETGMCLSCNYLKKNKKYQTRNINTYFWN
uniref:4-galactosyl-N-acetylglucosaminide 3-alpha-L-fucosyltransferase 9 n=2 Tax=Elephant endotheliotropic herpesvirus 1A TaxID=759753 RepID=A0A866VUQ9_ELHV1|nr:alpha-(1,3)fucosyltransferase [Elephant endotheliotropic herpesvirus 1A]